MTIQNVGLGYIGIATFDEGFLDCVLNIFYAWNPTFKSFVDDSYNLV